MTKIHDMAKEGLTFVIPEGDDKSAIRIMLSEKAVGSIFFSSKNPQWRVIFIYPMSATLLRIIADFMAVLKLPGNETDNGQSKETLQVDL